MHWPSRAYNNKRQNKQTNGWTGGRRPRGADKHLVGQPPEALSLLETALAVADKLGSCRQRRSGRISIKPTQTGWKPHSHPHQPHIHTHTHMPSYLYTGRLAVHVVRLIWVELGLGRGATKGSLTKIIKVKQCTNSFGLNDMRPYVCMPVCVCACVCGRVSWQSFIWQLGQILASSTQRV